MKVGCVGYCTEQGLGMLLRSFYHAGVVTHPMLVRHGHHENHPEWYPADTPRLASTRKITPELVEWIKGLDVFLAFETPFNWDLFDVCRDQGVRSALVPMYEWTPKQPKSYPDLVLCPSKLDRNYFPGIEGGQGWSGVKSMYLPVPVDPRIPWRPRETALRFLHNAGHVGHRGHKGTLELLKALPMVKAPISLTVRFQDPREVPEALRVRLQSTDVRVMERLKVEYGSPPYETLFDHHDVYIAPEKFNGLSLPLQEARAAGMLVMTSNRFPHNEWLPLEGLIPVKETQRASIGGSYFEFEECLVDPADIATTIDWWYGRSIAEYSVGGLEWARANSWDALKPRWMEALGHA